MNGTDLLFSPFAATSIIGLFTILLIYWFSVRNHDYWKKKGIPYIKPLPFLGCLLDGFRKPFQSMEYERYNKFGRMYGHFEGSKALLSVADPALLKKILVKDFQYFTTRRVIVSGDNVLDSMLSIINGEDWKRIRTVVSPTFSTGKIKRMLSIFKDCTKTLVQNLTESAKEGKPVNIKRLYGTFSMDVIASSAFSTKIDSHNDPDNQFVKNARDLFQRGFDWRVLLLFLFPKLIRFMKLLVDIPGPIDFFKTTACQIIKERQRTGQVRNDFLQLLMDTVDELKKEQKIDTATDNYDGDIASNYGENEVGHEIFKTVSSKTLSMDEVVAQCVTFFLGGHDTTANTISFASYLLALNPEIQDKLRKEIDEAFEKNDGELTYEAVQSMKYLDNVISETLRLYPPGIRLERTADADYKLGETGLTIPKGMTITIPAHAIHRDPEYFPNPEKFDPDRFTAEERAKRHNYVYLPFGAGPRNCVAMRFALLQVKVCMAYVFRTFIMKQCPETKVPIEFAVGLGIMLPMEIMLKIEPRAECLEIN